MTMFILGVLLTGLTLVLMVPVAVFCVQVFSSLFKSSDFQVSTYVRQNEDSHLKVAVLIPAHNESSRLLPTLDSIRSQIFQQDQILVVADNCSDDTAEQARHAGVQVIERTDIHRRGKGYALDFGVQYLSQNPPDILVIVDADCILSPQALQTLVACCYQMQSPVQAYYPMLLTPHQGSASLKTKVAAFAWQVKNLIRPLGMKVFGGACQLMGTGMAFPWDLIRRVELANGNLVEDMKLGLDLAALGKAPLFCPSACVTSYFPTSAEGAQTQRTRWEHGHLHTIVSEVPLLLWQSLRTRNAQLLGMTLDLAVPPLALLVMLILLLAVLNGCYVLLGGQFFPFWMSLIQCLFIVFAVFIAWHQVGRSVITLFDLLKVPVYLLWKIPLYVKYVFGKQVEWVRSQRDNPKK